MEIATYQCDQCLPRRTLRLQDSNNWFRGYFLEDLGDQKMSATGVLILPITVEHLKIDGKEHLLPKPTVHLCGIECAQKWAINRLSSKNDYDPTKGDQL